MELQCDAQHRLDAGVRAVRAKKEGRCDAKGPPNSLLTSGELRGQRVSSTATAVVPGMREVVDGDVELEESGMISDCRVQLMLLGAVVIPTLAASSSLGVPHEFVPGTTAVAAEVNENFDAVEQAVNDNDARLVSVEDRVQQNESAIETAQQRLDSAEAAVNDHENRIATLEPLAESRSISIAGSAFRSLDGPASETIDNRCLWGSRNSEVGRAYFLAHSGARSLGGICTVLAGINFPDDVDLQEVVCHVVKNDRSPARISLHLFRINSIQGVAEPVFQAGLFGNSSPAVQLLHAPAPVPGRNIVDNGKFAYVLRIAFIGFDFTTVDNLVRLHGCIIRYSTVV